MLSPERIGEKVSQRENKRGIDISFNVFYVTKDVFVFYFAYCTILLHIVFQADVCYIRGCMCVGGCLENN